MQHTVHELCRVSQSYLLFFNGLCVPNRPKKAFKFLKNTKSGLCSFHDYPYVAKDEHAAGCSLKKGSCTSVNHSHVKKFSRKKNKNEKFLKRMVVKAPPAALMDASQVHISYVIITQTITQIYIGKILPPHNVSCPTQTFCNDT